MAAGDQTDQTATTHHPNARTHTHMKAANAVARGTLLSHRHRIWFNPAADVPISLYSANVLSNLNNASAASVRRTGGHEATSFRQMWVSVCPGMLPT